MKHVIRMATHIIIGGVSMLLFAGGFASTSEFVSHFLATMLLTGGLYFLRHQVKTFWVFMVSHVALLFGGIFLIPIVSAYNWYIAIWVFWILYSAILRLVPVAEWLEAPCVPYVSLFVVFYVFICILEGSLAVQRVSLVATAIMFLLYLLYGNLESMDEFILTGSFSNQVDEQGIRKLNNRLSILYTGALGILLLLFSLFRVDGLWQTILVFIRKVLRFLLSFLPMSEPALPEEEEEVEQGMGNLASPMPEEHEISAFVHIMNDILRGLMTVVIVAAILAGIIYAAMYIYRHFYKKDSREEGNKVIESLSFGEGTHKERKSRFFERLERNPAKRIRKIYKKNLKRLAQKRTCDLSYLSPKQQVELLYEQGASKETIEEIKRLYEDARYSANPMTEAQAEHMRKLF